MKKEFTLTEMSIVENFIQEYKRSKVVIESTVRAVMKRVLEYEKVFEKPFYEFDKDEALQMLQEVNTISITSLQNKVLLLRHAVDWINFTRGENNTNIWEKITKEDLLPCVVKRTLITNVQLQEIQAQLLNKVDRAILMLLFEGAGGHWCHELCYISPENVSKSNMTIYFKTGKHLLIDDEQYALLQSAMQEQELVSYTPGSLKVIKVTGFIYKIRGNTLSENDNERSEIDREKRYRYIQRRLHLMSEYLGIKLSTGWLQDSGLYYYLRKGMANTGLSMDDYLNTEEAHRLAKRYDINSPLFKQIIMNKFGQYLE